MDASFWSTSNAWWRAASNKMALGTATEGDWEVAVRRLWDLTRAVAEASDLSYHDRQDVVQTLVEKLLDPDTIKRLAEVDTPAHYLAEVMKNHLLNVGTRNKVAAKALARYGELAKKPDDERPAVETVIDRETQKQIRYLVNHVVSAEDRKLLWGVARDGRSLEDLATERGITVEAVAKRLSRARKRLKDLYRE